MHSVSFDSWWNSTTILILISGGGNPIQLLCKWEGNNKGAEWGNGFNNQWRKSDDHSLSASSSVQSTTCCKARINIFFVLILLVSFVLTHYITESDIKGKKDFISRTNSSTISDVRHQCLVMQRLFSLPHLVQTVSTWHLALVTQLYASGILTRRPRTSHVEVSTVLLNFEFKSVLLGGEVLVVVWINQHKMKDPAVRMRHANIIRYSIEKIVTKI